MEKETILFERKIEFPGLGKVNYKLILKRKDSKYSLEYWRDNTLVEKFEGESLRDIYEAAKNYIEIQKMFAQRIGKIVEERWVKKLEELI